VPGFVGLEPPNTARPEILTKTRETGHQ
jgi:hypothetical protein